jgi:hypothetical protein
MKSFKLFAYIRFFSVGMTKVKMMKEESGSMDFVEKRRAALERYVACQDFYCCYKQYLKQVI